jgi:hypothetical protein
VERGAWIVASGQDLLEMDEALVVVAGGIDQLIPDLLLQK